MLRRMVRWSALLLFLGLALSVARAAPPSQAPAAAAQGKKGAAPASGSPISPAPDTLEIAPGAAPSCASWATTHIDCFVIGNDRQVWRISWDNDTDWGAWSSLGPPAQGGDSIGGIWALTRGVDSLDVFVVGVSGSFTNLYLRTLSGGSWGAWQNLEGPGVINVYEIACTTLSATNIDCFIRGSDNHLWQRTWNGTTWNSWGDLGAFPSETAIGGLAATTYGTGNIVVYAIGGDGHAYRRYYEGSWSAWQDDGFPTGFPLRQVACHTLDSEHIDCSFTDSSGGVWYRRWTAGVTQWGPFTDLAYPPSYASGTALTHYGATGTVVLANAANGRFYRRFRNTDAAPWSEWIDLGRPPDLQNFLPAIIR